MTTRLDGRVAIVTGGGNGIGRAYVQGLAREGARVAVVDLDGAAARRVADEVRRGGGEALDVACDVASAEAVRAMVDRVAERFGTVHVLVNNAGIYPGRPWTEIDEAEWDRVMAVNLKAVFLCARAVHPWMQRQRYGKIVNIASDTVLVGTPNILHYVSAKAGVVGLTRALAREVGPDGIRVNVILPGLTETETVMRSLGDAYFDRIVERQALPGREQPDDLVGAVVFLSGPESDFITGQSLAVNGGFAMH